MNEPTDMNDLDPQIREALRTVRLPAARRSELAAMAEAPPARARWQPWALGLAVAATLSLVALPLLPDTLTNPVLEATGSGLLAGPDLQMSDVDRARTGPFEVLVVGETVRSLGVLEAERGDDVLNDPAVRSLPDDTTVRLLGIAGERRTLMLEQSWSPTSTMQRTFIVDPETDRSVGVAVRADSGTLVAIEADRQVALWIVDHQRRGNPMRVKTEFIYDQRLVSFDIDPLDGWVGAQEDVALILDGRVASTGVLFANTGTQASVWMSQEMADELVRSHTSGGQLRLARIDPFDPEMATVAVSGGTRVRSRIEALTQHVQ